MSGSKHDVYTIGTTDLLYPATCTIEAYVEDAWKNATNSKRLTNEPYTDHQHKNVNKGKVAAVDLVKFEISVYGASSAKYTITLRQCERCTYNW